LINKRFYEKNATVKATPPKIEDKLSMDFQQSSDSRKLPDFYDYQLKKQNFKFKEKSQVYKTIPNNQINQRNFDIEIKKLKALI
jgi:hypothetical protein